jgi:HAMP domain-containing protein
VTHPESDRRACEAAGERPAAFGGVASKIVLLVFAATFLTATVVSWVSIESSGVSLRGMIDRLYPLAVDHAASRIDPWIRAAQLHLERAAHHSNGDLAGAAHGQVDGLAIFDIEGGKVQSWGVVPDAAAEALDAPDGVAVVALDAGGFGLAIAPHREAGQRRIVGVMSLDRIASMLELELPSERAMLALVDGGGRVLAKAGSPPAGAVLEHLDLASLRSDGPLRETLLGGVHVIGAAQRIDLLDWHVAVLTPFDDAYDSVLTAVGRIFLIDLGVILVFSLLAYRVAVHVMRPFERLSDAVRRGAESDADAELVIPEIATRDEIGALSRTFARMLRQQKAQREEIEEKNRSLVDRNLRLQGPNGHLRDSRHERRAARARHEGSQPEHHPRARAQARHAVPP